MSRINKQRPKKGIIRLSNDIEITILYPGNFILNEQARLTRKKRGPTPFMFSFCLSGNDLHVSAHGGMASSATTVIENFIDQNGNPEVNCLCFVPGFERSVFAQLILIDSDPERLQKHNSWTIDLNTTNTMDSVIKKIQFDKQLNIE